MKVSIWDTYVQKKDGSTMHFDIVVPAHITGASVVHGMGHAYLAAKGQAGQPLTARECRFCHQEAASPDMATAIAEKGYYIIEMEGCR